MRRLARAVPKKCHFFKLLRKIKFFKYKGKKSFGFLHLDSTKERPPVGGWANECTQIWSMHPLKPNPLRHFCTAAQRVHFISLPLRLILFLVFLASIGVVARHADTINFSDAARLWTIRPQPASHHAPSSTPKGFRSACSPILPETSTLVKRKIIHKWAVHVWQNDGSRDHFHPAKETFLLILTQQSMEIFFCSRLWVYMRTYL